jgi:hypothetical protein
MDVLVTRTLTDCLVYRSEFFSAAAVNIVIKESKLIRLVRSVSVG